MSLSMHIVDEMADLILVNSEKKPPNSPKLIIYLRSLKIKVKIWEL